MGDRLSPRLLASLNRHIAEDVRRFTGKTVYEVYDADHPYARLVGARCEELAAIDKDLHEAAAAIRRQADYIAAGTFERHLHPTSHLYQKVEALRAHELRRITAVSVLYPLLERWKCVAPTPTTPQSSTEEEKGRLG